MTGEIDLTHVEESKLATLDLSITPIELVESKYRSRGDGEDHVAPKYIKYKNHVIDARKVVSVFTDLSTVGTTDPIILVNFYSSEDTETPILQAIPEESEYNDYGSIFIMFMMSGYAVLQM